MTTAAPSSNSGNSRPTREFLRGYRAARELILAGTTRAGIAAMHALGHDEHPDVANYIGYANRKIGNYEQSKVWYEAALKADPNHIRTWSYYGMWQMEQGNRLKAEDDLQKVKLFVRQHQLQGIHRTQSGDRRQGKLLILTRAMHPLSTYLTRRHPMNFARRIAFTVGKRADCRCSRPKALPASASSPPPPCCHRRRHEATASDPCGTDATAPPTDDGEEEEKETDSNEEQADKNRQRRNSCDDYRAARELILAGNYQGGIAAMHALGHDDNPDVANYIGYAYRKHGRLRGFEDLVREGAQRRPQPRAHLVLLRHVADGTGQPAQSARRPAEGEAASAATPTARNIAELKAVIDGKASY